MGDLSGIPAVGNEEMCNVLLVGTIHPDCRAGTVHCNAVAVETQPNGCAVVAHRYIPCLVDHNIASQIVEITSGGPLHMAVFIRSHRPPV